MKILDVKKQKTVNLVNIDKVSNTYRHIPYICLQINSKLLVSNHIQQLTHYCPIFIKLTTQNAFVGNHYDFWI